MTKRFCDRCGKEVTDLTMLSFLRTKHTCEVYLWSNNIRDTTQEAYHDICRDCENSLYHWFAAGKKAQELTSTFREEVE